MKWHVRVVLLLLISPEVTRAATVITNTPPEIAQMAGMWEADSVQVSPLANAKYPTFTTTWEYIVPHTSISAAGDMHINTGFSMRPGKVVLRCS